MEERYKKKFTKKVVCLASEKYGVSVNDMLEVGTHQNFVYKVKSDKRFFYIRITHSDHRDSNQITAELEWIKYLDVHDINVATPIKSLEGNDYEIVYNNKDTFIVVAFSQALGFGIGQQPWSDETPKQLGVLTARMHNLASQYIPKSEIRRFDWFENNFIVRAKEYLPNKQKGVLDELDKLVREIRQLPISSDSYGLIHGDLVACNYNIDSDNNITFFDFDEASYCWYINDIAVQLFYWGLGTRGFVELDDAIHATNKFFEGYRSIRDISSDWVQKVPLFLKLREIILYIAIHRSRNLDELDLWTENFMKDRQHRIESAIPFYDIDFSKL